MHVEKLKAILLYNGFTVSEKMHYPILASGGNLDILRTLDISMIVLADIEQPISYQSLNRNQRMAVHALCNGYQSEH